MEPFECNSEPWFFNVHIKFIGTRLVATMVPRHKPVLRYCSEPNIMVDAFFEWQYQSFCLKGSSGGSTSRALYLWVMLISLECTIFWCVFFIFIFVYFSVPPSLLVPDIHLFSTSGKINVKGHWFWHRCAIIATSRHRIQNAFYFYVWRMTRFSFISCTDGHYSRGPMSCNKIFLAPISKYFSVALVSNYLFILFYFTHTLDP